MIADAAVPAWPAWSMALAILVAVIAVYCSVRLSLRAVTQIWRIARRANPRRPVWPWRGSRTAVMTILMVVTAVTCFLATRRLQATAASTPAPAPATIPARVDVPAPLSTTSMAQPGVQPATPATFVRGVVPLLERNGLTHTQALLFAAHLARETGWGRWVRGHNFGNIKTGNWSGSSFQLTDRLGFNGTYRSYNSAEAGVRDAVALIRDSRRYRRAWTLLRAGDSRWYGQLGLDGYYEGRPERGQHGVHTLASIGDVQREYESIVSLVQRYAGTRG
jgi:hypothetical protein